MPPICRVLIFHEEGNREDTFTKTALKWAGENSDRVNMMEILREEHKCHDFDMDGGLRCLKQTHNLDGDEMLKWTIETFKNLYPDMSTAEKCIVC